MSNNETNTPIRHRDTHFYRILNEVLNSVTHGFGFGAAVTATVFLIIKGVAHGSALEITAYTIYGVSMCLMFLFSTLYHSLKFTKAEKVFHILDHSGIFFLIAGTYTPYTLISIGGALGITIFVIEWLLAIVGIFGKIFKWKFVMKYSTWIYAAMGWVALFALKPLFENMGLGGALWLLGGGLIYTIGIIFYGLGKRRNIPYAHVVWHIFVFLAAVAMFISIYVYV